MSMSRRNLFNLGGNAIAAGLLANPGMLIAESAQVPVKAERHLGKMKIKDVQSASIADEYTCNLIKITTDSGLYGLGEARPKISIAKKVEEFKGLVIGEDPLRVEYLQRKMMAANKSPSMADIGTIAGIETALWDLAGKILHTPTYNLLGGSCRDKIKVYCDLAPADTPKTTEPTPWVERARKAKSDGFKALKVDIYRGGGDVPEWVRILTAIRAEIGPDMQLGVEFHWRLNAQQTDLFIAMAEAINLWFIEDPMKYDENIAHYQRIAAERKIPVVALEQMQTRKSFHGLMEKRMCTIIEPDAQYCGGISELKRVADLGELYGMNVLCHNMCTPIGTYAQAHACATMPSFLAMENACAEGVAQLDGPLYQDGHLVLNDKPGFGIELNEDYCRKHLSNGSSFFSS